MKVYRFDTSMEPMVSRIPSMFAYLEFNDDWTTTLHPASDSFDGAWGKVVENIALPCDVNLCTYISIDDEPTPYLWNNANTFPIGENIEDEYNIDSSEYIRRIEEYVYIEEDYSEYETYVEVDPFPEDINSDSPIRIKVPKRDKVGDYILDCDQNKTYDYYVKETNYSYYKKFCLLTEGGTYTYRTLIDYYYRYKDTLPANNTFILFMEKAIGKVKVDKQLLQLDNESEYPNVPDYVYLGYVKRMIEVYRKYHRICEYYRVHYLNIGETDNKLAEKCDYYKTIGGDVFLRYLESLVKTLNDVASEYLCYANNRANDLELSLNVPLFQSKNDLGYLSCHINEFVPGEHYRHGELLTYDGRTHICILNRFIPGGNNYEYCLCNGTLYKLSNNTYNTIQVGEALTSDLPLVIYNGYTYIIFNGDYYMWQSGEYKKIEVTEYCSGLWNENLEVNEFDPQHFVLLTEYVNNDLPTLSIPEKTALSDKDGWYNQDNTYGNHFQIYVTVTNLPNHFVYKNIKRGNIFYIWDEALGMYIVDPTNATSYVVEGKADSLLKSLRKFEQFVDDSEFTDEPATNEDWLYYYKIGNFYTDRGILWDEFGNIQRFTDVAPVVGQYVTDLKAYGTILTDIQCDTVEKTLTFTYVVNGHLKAVLDSVDVDDDGNQLYKYRPFEYDDNDSHGIVYVETYHYLDSDIDELVANGDFQAFVEDRPEDIVDYMIKYGYKRFRFSIENSTATINIGTSEYEYGYVRSDFSETVENELDYIYQPLFKKDYFTGYAYEPNVENEIDIRRGNAATYERHLRLGECKTFDDLSQVQNSGFYTFTE